jgi:hypothetical protein
MAGKIQKQMAEKVEDDMKYDIAVTYYKKAADYFSMENTNSKSFEQSCLLKAADIMCQNNLPGAYEVATKVRYRITLF